MKEELKEQKLLKLIPKEKLIKILSSLYTYNHGDKDCYPFEYVRKEGDISNGGGDYKKLEKELRKLGYYIVMWAFEDYSKKGKQQQIEFKQRRMGNYFIPRDVKKIILMDKEMNVIPLYETPLTLEFLAKNGDERAKTTFYNFESRLKGCGEIIDLNRKKAYKK